MAIHRRVFEGVFKFAGQLRTVNITKKEWILEGDTVRYVSADEIRQTIEYDLSQEKQVDYTQLSMEAVILQLAKFTSEYGRSIRFGRVIPGQRQYLLSSISVRWALM